MKKNAVVSVSNDLTTDQRVRKICDVLLAKGYQVTLIGRKLSGSLPVDRPYRTIRFRLLFNKGALFYAALNFRLFWRLMFIRADVFYANDLDTLLANFIVSRMRRKPLIYDSHEYFTEVPELQGRKFAKGTWLRIERWIFPKLKYVFTVNNSIADIYSEKYKVNVRVMRNVPMKNPPVSMELSRTDLGLPEDKHIIILQGSGINVDRGSEEMVEAMKSLPGYLLLIVGGGDVIPQLKRYVNEEKLEQSVRFIDRLPYDQMMQYTCNADVGVTLDKPTNLNYKLSLPNKIFDYLKAGIPVVSSDLIEVASIVRNLDVGVIVKNHDPEVIASTIRSFFEDTERYQNAVNNAKKGVGDYCWEKEQKELVEVLRSI